MPVVTTAYTKRPSVAASRRTTALQYSLSTGITAHSTIGVRKQRSGVSSCDSTRWLLFY